MNGRFPFLLLTCSPAATSSFGSENAGIAGLRPLLDNGNAAIVKTQFVRKTTERCGEKETLKGENNGAVEWLKDKKLLCVCVCLYVLLGLTRFRHITTDGEKSGEPETSPVLSILLITSESCNWSASRVAGTAPDLYGHAESEVKAA